MTEFRMCTHPVVHNAPANNGVLRHFVEIGLRQSRHRDEERCDRTGYISHSSPSRPAACS